jgi:CubicO group peptidase (beta-lactamase class C family)
MKNHHRSICLFPLAVCFLLASLSGLAQAPVPTNSVPPPDFAAKVDEYVAAQIKINQFSGAVLLAKDGTVLLSKGYGLANREFDLPNTPQTKFRLGSITKQFTAAAILLLEERGKLSTDDPIGKHLDQCPEVWKPITIHHLLTHTSGIPSYTDSPDYRRKMAFPTSTAEMVARFRDQPLEFPVGDRFKYSNSGYFLLGAIIEKAAGQSYEAFLRASIFEPLGMKDSGYDRFETILPRRATGYAIRKGVLENSAYLDMGQPYAAGSLYSTTEDLFRWERALAARQLLSAASYEKMYTPCKGDYAYGWSVATRFRRKVISHGGGINGFSTMISRYPDDEVCVIVLSNLQSANAGRISRDLEALLFGEKYETPRERVIAKIDPAIYDAYVGKYELSPTFVLTVTRDGDRLLTQATNQPQVEVFPESETKFFLRAVDAQISFGKDQTGVITHLVLHQGGRDQTAKKVK